jgi:hypothetical protein
MPHLTAQIAARKWLAVQGDCLQAKTCERDRQVCGRLESLLRPSNSAWRGNDFIFFYLRLQLRIFDLNHGFIRLDRPHHAAINALEIATLVSSGEKKFERTVEEIIGRSCGVPLDWTEAAPYEAVVASQILR